MIRQFPIVLLAMVAATATAHPPEFHTADPPPTFTTRPNTLAVPPPVASDAFQFVIYGDRTGGLPAGLKVLEQAVADTNLLDPDLVMTVGDLIQGYNDTPQWLEQAAEYREIMDKLNMRWFPVPGNHDVYWRGEGEAPPGQHEGNYEKHFGPLWYSFEHKNAGFICLYTDEGDPATNMKNFSVPALQKMSDTQLDFLRQSLERLKDVDHVMLFLHHPRWLPNYDGGNWDVVEKMLIDAGNVTAVFAGHIHHMRFDQSTSLPAEATGRRGGIDYYTLATTGGHLAAEIPDAGWLHHLNVVTVRPDKITVAAIPVGAVFDPKTFSQEFVANVESAMRIAANRVDGEIALRADGSAAGEVTYQVKNSGNLPIDWTMSITNANGWRVSPDHDHGQLAVGKTLTMTVAAFRPAGELAAVTVPELTLQAELIGESARVRLPSVSTPLRLRASVLPSDLQIADQNRAVRISADDDAVRIDSSEFSLPQGPMTLEAMIRPDRDSGYVGVIAKTQSSDYALFLDEGVPVFSLHVGGAYRNVSGSDKLPTDRMSHIAAVYDETHLTLFVDGKPVGQVAASGKRKTNDLPLFLGADPDGGGRPTRGFRGLIDEVRLSSSARYDDAFEPAVRHKPDDSTVLLLHADERLGPFLIDHSGSAAVAVMGDGAVLETLQP